MRFSEIHPTSTHMIRVSMGQDKHFNIVGISPRLYHVNGLLPLGVSF
jgi:hypothetical protein